MMAATAAKPDVGSIVIRWSSEPTPTIVVGQIIEPAEGTGRWNVHVERGTMEVWHRLTILRRVADWREANGIVQAQLTAIRMATVMREAGADVEMVRRVLSTTLDHIARGDWA